MDLDGRLPQPGPRAPASRVAGSHYAGRVAELKTSRTGASVADFLAAVPDDRRRADAAAACTLIAEVTCAEPEMWGPSLVGFGSYAYRYDRGPLKEWPTVSLSPRKQSLTIYFATGVEPYADLLARLGPHSTGKSCLHLKRLADADEWVLREMVDRSFRELDGKTVTPGSGA